MSLCLHEVAVAVEAHKQNRDEDFNHIDTTTKVNSIP
jgi:hypothetical protein